MGSFECNVKRDDNFTMKKSIKIKNKLKKMKDKIKKTSKKYKFSIIPIMLTMEVSANIIADIISKTFGI